MSKKLSIVLSAMLALSPVAASVGYAQAQVAISADQISSLLASCRRGSCTAALQSLIAAVRAVNPNISVSAVAAAIAAEVSSSYNAGAVNAAVARSVLEAVSSTPGVTPSVNTAVQTALASVDVGAPVDLQAVADAGSAT